jgi:hypothetical protein
MVMGQSIGSVGNSHHTKARGANNQQKNQPSANPGQRLSDQQPSKPEKGDAEGGVEQGARAKR